MTLKTALDALLLLGKSIGLIHTPIKQRQFSDVDDALDTQQRNELVAVFSAMLDEQYNAIAPSRVLRGQDRATITESQLLPLVSEAMPSSADTLDYENALLLLLFFSGMGQAIGIDELPRTPTGAERIDIQSNGRDWVVGRLNALLGIGNQGQAGSISNPELPKGLDETTITRITNLILLAIREAGEGATLRQITEIYQELAQSEIENRAVFIADDNAATSLSNGQYVAIVGLADQTPIAKTWLRTRSKVPREIHLQQVGVTVPFNGVFPSGDSWSQELPNCKCGIRVTFASGREQEFRL